jgi:hypothetical protein
MPPELAAEVRPVEPVLSESAPSEANPAHPEVSMLDVSAEAKRAPRVISNLLAGVSASSGGLLLRPGSMSRACFRNSA